jgi:uncharacterized protein (DUF924 family)
MRTARSRISGEKRFDFLFMAPSSQSLEPPQNPGRFKIVDQFSRNVYRDTPQAFAQDALALALAQELVASGQDRSLPLAQRSFAYMPYMHSESALVHTQAALLFAQPGLEDTLRFEQRHQAIIERFGRYPHRNAILGRESTPEELAFLREPGSGF